MSAAAGAAGGSTPSFGAKVPAGALVRPNTASDDAFVGTASESPTQLAISRLLANKIGMVSLVVLIMIFVVSFSGGWFEQHWAHRTASQQNLSGSVTIGGKTREVVDIEGMPQISPGFHKQYMWGADGLGRDVFIRSLRGGSVSLRIGVGATMITIILGTLVGMVGGFYGGPTDKALSYVVDIMIAFPFMVFAIGLSSVSSASGHLGPLSAGSLWIPTILLGWFAAFGFSRIIRANARELGEKEYVEAARALGANDRRIMFLHVLPHLFPTIITYAGIILSGSILGEAGLSFLGIGVQPPIPSWGNMIADGQAFYSTAWWIAGGGGLMVMLTVLSANLFGEAVEEAFDHKGSR
ncbi:MAG: ABC transporter permease [Gaiellales bacterium]